MQTAAEVVELPDGPTLALLEDATGAGKTEAALILAYRMMVSGYARRALLRAPHDGDGQRDVREDGERPPRASLPIARRSPWFTAVRTFTRDFVPSLAQKTTRTPEAGCARWLADDRRRSLLAEIGVGTIDQALMGVLPTRFSTLRLFGLTDRILIVDEAHAYDPYMQRQLETLLKMQAMNGGSAIVMTATLPLEMRQAYADAFRSGLGCQAAMLDHRDYPALAIVGTESRAEAVAPAPATRRSVGVERVDNADKAVELLAASAGDGAACVWVRNAVDDAIAAVHALRARGCSTHLLHARFALGDRLRHEDAVMDRFGRLGDLRAGQVLVGRHRSSRHRSIWIST